MRIHFISIGGAVMHNLALELQANGHEVTGSDDEVYQPSRGRLEKAGLLPAKMGWDANRITIDLDLIILGMHARINNPELLRAQELGLPIQSFPEFIGEHAKDKFQIIVAGSHGKTTTTSMIMHVLRKLNHDFDYLVGAQIEGFDRMVRLSNAKVIVIEGDEYLSSPIDRQPKFLHYNPDVLILTGIQWDHMNVFPEFDLYVGAFGNLLNKLSDKAVVFSDAEDDNLNALMSSMTWPMTCKQYKALNYRVEEGQFFLKGSQKALGVVGKHNMKNLSAAFLALQRLGIDDQKIIEGFESFTGAAKRLDLLVDTEELVLYRDFAHAPSKVKATLEGIRELYPDRHLIAVCELHTFSSLNKDFLPQYESSLDPADSAAVFYSPHTLEIKKMPALSTEDIKQSFANEEIHVHTDKNELLDLILSESKNQPAVILLMSSGTFGGMEVEQLIP